MNWLEIVNEVQPKAELDAVRLSVTRGRPFGPAAWVESMAAEMGLGFTLRQRGRPRKGDIQNILESDTGGNESSENKARSAGEPP